MIGVIDLKRWEGQIDFEKYYGERKYKTAQVQLQKQKFTDNEKVQMFRDIVTFIEQKDFRLYHDFMDDISISHPDWFNMLTFDRKINRAVLEYIKSKVMSEYR